MNFYIQDNFSEGMWLVRATNKDSLNEALREHYLTKEVPDNLAITVCGIDDFEFYVLTLQDIL